MLAALGTVATSHAAFWRWQATPVDVATGAGRLQSVSYSPSMRMEKDDAVDAQHIREDLIAISGVANAVRTYTVSEGQDRVVHLAGKHGLRISVGVWVGADAKRTAREIEKAVQLARSVRGIERIVVGNEALLRREITDAQLARLISDVRRQVPVHIKIGTSDTWSEMLAARKTAAASDFIGIHALPYWERQDSATAVASAFERIKQVRAAYPGKRIWVGEFGWPSNGDNFGAAEASRVDQASLIRDFAARARKAGVEYNIIEAFDQPWKTTIEGSVGPHWGIMDAARNPKWKFAGTVEEHPMIASVAIPAVLIGALVSILALFRRRATVLQVTAWSGAAHGAACLAGWAALALSETYMTSGTWIMWGSALVLGSILLAIALADFDEVSRTLLGRHAPRLLNACNRVRDPVGDPEARPFVSVHIAARNEDPAMLNATLDSLAAQTYRSGEDRPFEVVVAINNTSDKSYCHPVEAHCRALNEKLGSDIFKFADFQCSGFKAGALNRALTLSSPDTEVIAVLDADYAVHPEWLSRLAPAFSDPSVAIVQAPQEHRDGADSTLKGFMAAEYRAFFDSGMVERNEDNALVCHGTMIMIRRSALEQVGGWSEWCIVEDTELGLNLLERGWHIHYTTERLGWGITPDSYKDFRQQRHRWAYGSVQIMKAHMRRLLPGSRGLSGIQKMHFWGGWARWWSDALGLVAAVGAMTWTALATVLPIQLPPPEATLIALSALAFRALASLALTRFASRRPDGSPHGLIESLGTALVGMSLSYTVGMAVLKGLFTKHEPFKVTSKGKKKRAARFPALPEAVLAAALLTSAGAAVWINHADTLALDLWSALMVTMALPNLVAAFLAAGDMLPVREAGAQKTPSASPASPVRDVVSA